MHLQPKHTNPKRRKAGPQTCVAYAHFVQDGERGYGVMTQFQKIALASPEVRESAQRFLSLGANYPELTAWSGDRVLTALSIGLRAVMGDDDSGSMLAALAALGTKGGTGWLCEYDEVTKRARFADVSSSDIAELHELAAKSPGGNVLRDAFSALLERAQSVTAADAIPDEVRLQHRTR